MSIEELIRQAEQLPLEQQLKFVALLIEHIRQHYPTEKSHPHWRDIQGSAPYPLTGEDAQVWVSRTRQAGDEH
jgi:hypothetical protein